VRGAFSDRGGVVVDHDTGRLVWDASICYDPFHLVALASDALDEIRRDVWNQARREGQAQLARELKGARFALWKNPGNLTERQQLKLARVQQLNQRLYRAYLLSQQLREIYRVPFDDAIVLLDAWIAWARRCRLAPFVKLAKTITEQRAGIESALRHGLSNARVEQVNTQLRLITRRAFGFHSPHAAIALAMLALGGLCPSLPGR
jgi:transposase